MISGCSDLLLLFLSFMSIMGRDCGSLQGGYLIGETQSCQGAVTGEGHLLSRMMLAFRWCPSPGHRYSHSLSQ